MNGLTFCSSSAWAGFMEQLPCMMIWIVSIIALAAVLKAVLPIIIANCHECRLAKIKGKSEPKALGERERFDLLKNKLEFEQELEFEKKLWDKLLMEKGQPKDIEKEFEKLRKQFEELKKEYPKLRLDVEVSNKKESK